MTSQRERITLDGPELLGPGQRGYRRQKAGRFLRRLFVPTGHAELDQIRRDGLAAGVPWYSAVAAGVGAGLLLAVAVLLVYATYGLSSVAIVLALDGLAEARTLLASHWLVVGSYARYFWLTGLAVGAVGAGYACVRRWTVLDGRYVSLRLWDIGLHTLFAAAAGYVGMFIAASLWPPFEQIHRHLFWAWGPVVAWSFPRLQDMLLLLIVRPNWRLSVQSTALVLVPRRFRCGRDEVTVDADEETRAVTITAPIVDEQVERVRELIQAIPETAAVKVRTDGAVASAEPGTNTR